jgi:hypothetical protein
MHSFTHVPWRGLSALLAAALLAGACAPTPAERAAPVPAPAPLRAPAGMVVSANAIASRVGMEVLRRAATRWTLPSPPGFALAVVHPPPATSAAAASW